MERILLSESKSGSINKKNYQKQRAKGEGEGIGFMVGFQMDSLRLGWLGAVEEAAVVLITDSLGWKGPLEIS